jgi:iron complex outermembrane recepter protein
MKNMLYIKLLSAVLLSSTALPAWAQQEAKPALQEGEANLTDIVVTANRRTEKLQDVSGVVQSLSAEQIQRSGIADLRNLQIAVPGLSIANQEGNVEIFIRGVGSANNTELGDPGAAPHLNGVYIPRPRGLGVMFYDLERVEVNKGPQGTLYGRNALAGTLNIITAKPKFDGFSGYAQGEVANRSSYGGEVALNIPLAENFAVRLAGFYTNKDFGFNNVSTDPRASGLKPAGLEENYAGRLSLLWEPTDKLSLTIVADYGKETGTGYPGANIFAAVTQSGLRPEDLELKDVVYRGRQGRSDNELWGVQGKLNYAFAGFGVELTGSYRSVDFDQINASADSIDFPGRNLATVEFDNFSTVFTQSKSKSQVYEVRLFADDDKRLRWNVGAFYFNEDQQAAFLSLADRGFCCFSGTEFTIPDVDGESYAFYADSTFDVNDRLRVFGGIRYTHEMKSRFGIGGNQALVLGGANFACCFGTRLGTEGFVPALLNRPNFDLSGIDTLQERARFLVEGIATPGARDTLIQQIGSIANGTNQNGTCFVRADIDNGFLTCPTNTNGGFSFVNLTIPVQQVGRSEFDFVDFRAGIEFDLSDDNMVYAKVSTGHKAGGFNDSFADNRVPETFEPEKVVVYEVGSRNAFEAFGKQAIFNLTGFYYDYSNQVFQDLTCINLDTMQNPPVCTGFTLTNRNIGTSRILGLEVESRFQLPGNFSLDINAAYVDTKIRSGVVADARAQDFGQGGNATLINLDGNRLPLASKFNVSAKLATFYDIGPGQFDAQILLNYRSSFFLTQFNEDDVVLLDGTRQNALAAGFPDRQTGFATINLGVGYTVDNFRFEAWVANLTNYEASQKAIVGSSLNLRFLNDARTFGVRARVNF